MKFCRVGMKIGPYSVGIASLRQQILSSVAVVVVFACMAAVSLILAPGANGMMGAALAGLMLLIAVIDARSYVIPNELTVAGFLLGVIHEIQHSSEVANAIGSATLRAGAAAAALGILYLIYQWLRGREGLGLGDVKLAGVAGAWLNTTTIPLILEVAALSALAVYFARQLILRRRIRSTDKLPFGAFLAPAIWAGWVFEIGMGINSDAMLY